MPHDPTRPGIALSAALALVLGACSSADNPVEPEPPGASEAAALVSVVPQGGATAVDRFQPVVIEFDHAVMPGMEAYADLHEGPVTGPEVPGSWTMSEDRTTMTFTPDAPLAPNTRYTIHLGGAMTDVEGRHVDFASYGSGMGGTWASSGMMNGNRGGHMGGQVGDQGYHMGQGWEHPTNGSYGMVFAFTTGA